MEPIWVMIGHVATGGVLAGLYLGALWLAVQRLPSSPRPTVALLAGLVARAAGLAALLVVLTRGAPGAILLAGLGFVIARTLLLHAVAHRRVSWS